MKYYPQLAKLPTFTLRDAGKIIGNDVSAPKQLNLMLKEGSIHRIKQNLYTCLNFATGDDYANQFQIATGITADSFVSFHSAFEFYGFYNQSYFDIQVSSGKRFSPFDYNGYHYKCFLTKSLVQVKHIQGARVSTIERTIIDSIHMLGKVMDAEELVKCLNLIHHINEDKLLEMLSVYNMELLYRKVGYILSFYKNAFSLSDHFFNVCQENGNTSNKGYLVANDKASLTYNAAWGLYAYKDLKDLAYKGGGSDV